MSEGLTLHIGGHTFQNPVFSASGCFGHGFEMAPFTPLHKIGGIMLKTVTPTARAGNRPHRVREVDAGILSSIGLQNQGIDHFLTHTMPQVLSACTGGQIVVSIAGDTVEEYVEVLHKLTQRYGPADIGAIEVNGACPNVACGGGSFSRFPRQMEALVREITVHSPYPVIAKINTNFDYFCDSAVACEAGGAHAVHLVNTPIGMAIDIEARKPALGNIKGPVSGPAIRPIGVARTWDVYRAVQIPILSSGGVRKVEDALEYMMAGASGVAVGCAHFIEPNTSVLIAEQLGRYLREQGLSSLSEIVGAAH